MLETMDELKNYIREALETYDRDPPDTPFQFGHKAALLEIAKVLGVQL